MTVSKLPNIIFLDFDGVICNPATNLAVGDNTASYIDPVSCGLIKQLCIEFNCRIVISSSWRILYNQYAIQAILGAACPALGRYMYSDDRWKTGSRKGCTLEERGRGKEILDWINTYSTEFNNFVILDDDSDMEPLLDNFVKTDCYDGFRFAHFLKARDILLDKGI
jgi:hypothetical protein